MEQRHHFRSPYEADSALLHGTAVFCHRSEHIQLFNTTSATCAYLIHYYLNVILDCLLLIIIQPNIFTARSRDADQLLRPLNWRRLLVMELL